MTLYRKYYKRPPKMYKHFITRLPAILVHLDNVVESLLRPAVGLTINEVEDYRCPNFEEFLITEFLLGRHDPEIVQEYREAYDVNIERIHLDELGRNVSCVLLVIVVDRTASGIDWDIYDDVRISSIFEGRQYSYDAEEVALDELKELLEHAKEHLTRGIDHSWGMGFGFICG